MDKLIMKWGFDYDEAIFAEKEKRFIMAAIGL